MRVTSSSKKPLCQTDGHAWRPVPFMADGWFQCARSECRVYAVCPFCLGCLPTGVSVFVTCEQHRSYDLSQWSFDPCTPACSSSSVSYEAVSLWDA